jgi:integrase
MSLYKQTGSSIWSTRFSFRGKPIRRSTGHTDPTAAQRFEDELKAELWKQPEVLKGKTWGNAVLKWAKAETRSESDLQSLAKFGSYFHDRLLVDITPQAVDEALAKFCSTSGTYTRYRTRISAILKMAGVSIQLMRRKSKAVNTREWLTHEQWDRLRKELRPHMLPMATFALYTGMRQANVLGLTWSRVDLERKIVWVEAGQMKAKKAIGVPLSIEALNVLKTVQGQHDEFVFTFRGKPVKEIKTAFQSACIRAGIGRMEKDKDHVGYAGFTWHGFRHTFATWHFQAGTPREIIQRLGGWEDPRMLDNYTHHAPSHTAKFVNNIGPVRP